MDGLTVFFVNKNTEQSIVSVFSEDSVYTKYIGNVILMEEAILEILEILEEYLHFYMNTRRN